MAKKYIDAKWHSPKMGEYPIKFGKYMHQNYPQIPCLVFYNGMYGVRFWNCTEECWDDEDCDDFFCEKEAVEKWLYLDSLQQDQDLIVINKKTWEAQEQFRKNKDFGKPLQQEQPCAGYDEAYLNEKIAKASKTWEGVDVDKYMAEMRGYEQPSEDLESEIEKYFQGLWPGMETAEQCDTDMHFTPPAIMRLARHFYELGQRKVRQDVYEGRVHLADKFTAAWLDDGEAKKEE